MMSDQAVIGNSHISEMMDEGVVYRSLCFLTFCMTNKTKTSVRCPLPLSNISTSVHFCTRTDEMKDSNPTVTQKADPHMANSYDQLKGNPCMDNISSSRLGHARRHCHRSVVMLVIFPFSRLFQISDV